LLFAALNFRELLFLSGMETENNSPHIQFWTNVNKSGDTALIQLLTKLKYRNNYNPINTKENPYNDRKLNNEYFKKLKKDTNIYADLTGGFVKYKDLHKIARQIGYSFNTLRLYLKRLERLNLVIRYNTGWLLKSITEIGKYYGVEIKKLIIKAKDRYELKIKHSLAILKEIKYRAAKKTHQTKSTMSVLISCHFLAKKAGFKSSATGHRIETILESEKKVKIEHGKIKIGYQKFLNDIRYTFRRDCNIINVCSHV
jgi:hypothetical protein